MKQSLLRKSAALAIAVAGLLALGAAYHGTAAEAAPSYPNADNVRLSQQCLPDGRVRLNINWTSYGLGPQWVDLSVFNNGFIFGTFLGWGPLSPYTNSLSWDGLLPNTQHFLRVNALTPYGWTASQTVTIFTQSCGGCPQILISPPIASPCPPPPPPPPPLTCATGGPYAAPAIIISPGISACVTANKPVYFIGEQLTVCYTVSQPMWVNIVGTRPNGSTYAVVTGYDDGTGGCVSPGPVGFPFGTRTLTMYGGVYSASQVLDTAQFTVQ